MKDPGLGPLLHHFEVTRADQRSLAFVRGAAALLCAVCALGVLLARVSVPIFLTALLGLLMSFAWLAQARRAARMAATPEAHYLSVHRDGLVLADPGQLTRVAFAEVDDITLDEDRLDIALTLRDRRCVRIEPRYPGVEIHELMHKLQAARAGRAPSGT